MRFDSLKRILPLALLAAGLTITVFVSSRVAGNEQDERSEARRAISELVLSQAHDIEGQLIDQMERVEALARVALDADDLDAQMDAAGAFNRDSPVRAVFVRRQGDVDVAFASDTVRNPDLPLVTEGLTSIDSGIWANTLSIGLETEDTAGAEVVVLVDKARLIESLEASPAIQVESVMIIGLPGEESLETDTGGWLAYPNGVFRQDEQSSALVTTPTTIVDTNVSLEVMVAAEELWLPSSSETVQVALAGVIASLSIAGGAWFVVRAKEEALLIREDAELALDVAATRFRAGFTHAPIGVVELASDGTIIAANPRFASQLGYAPEELESMDVLDLIDGDDRAQASEQLKELLTGDVDSEQADRRYRGRNGNAVWVRESMSVLISEDGTRHVLIQAEDISDERRTQAELHRKALFDDLTGLPNRANLMARLNRVLDVDRAPGDVLAVMFVDLDKFKQVNDTLGHEAGDLLLIEVALRLKHACRSSDTVARLGGDEFVVVCEGLPDEESAELAAERFAETLRAPMFIDDVEVPVSASIGLVVSPDAHSPDDVLKQADQAMYRAKSSGRNQLIRYDIDASGAEGPGADGPAGKVEIDDLRKALRHRELRLHYQPVVRSGDGTIVGLEALVRWEHPELGLLTPPSFLPLAEELGIVEKIDAWVLKQGLAALGRLAETSEATNDWYLTFNLAPTNYNRRDFSATFESYVREAAIDPRRIVLERNEVWFMNQTPTAVLNTRELRAFGARISLDHFGTGSSSLDEVSTLEFDQLKIDRSFVRDAETHMTYVLEALKNMSDALGLKAVVEGVETEDELRIVRKAGIEFAQGFHLCRPVDEETLIREYAANGGSVIDPDEGTDRGTEGGAELFGNEGSDQLGSHQMAAGSTEITS